MSGRPAPTASGLGQRMSGGTGGPRGSVGVSTPGSLPRVQGDKRGAERGVQPTPGVTQPRHHCVLPSRPLSKPHSITLRDCLHRLRTESVYYPIVHYPVHPRRPPVPGPRYPTPGNLTSNLWSGPILLSLELVPSLLLTGTRDGVTFHPTWPGAVGPIHLLGVDTTRTPP